MSLMDISGIEPEVLELTPVDWTSHPTETEHFLTREYTLLSRGGLEPPTTRLKAVRSNQLSYRDLSRPLDSNQEPLG